jgi:hypothetical protein
MGLLQKISWNTRKWNLKFNLLEVYLHDGDGCWGFSFCEVIKKYRPYSLLSIEFRLPNGAERTKVQITNWDFLYLSTPLYDWYLDLDESITWGHKPTRVQRIGINIVQKLFK